MLEKMGLVSLDSTTGIEQFIFTRGLKPSNLSTVIFHNEADFKLMPYLQKKSYYARGFDGYIQKWS
jgi:hypothetical protein